MDSYDKLIEECFIEGFSTGLTVDYFASLNITMSKSYVEEFYKELINKY